MTVADHSSPSEDPFPGYSVTFDGLGLGDLDTLLQNNIITSDVVFRR